MMTIYELIKGHLTANGFDGLYNDTDCGCQIDDLAPCAGIQSDCKPGYVAIFPNGGWGVGPKAWIPKGETE